LPSPHARLLRAAVISVCVGQPREVHAVVPVLDRRQPDEFSLEYVDGALGLDQL
jgi:hypothetical protein